MQINSIFFIFCRELRRDASKLYNPMRVSQLSALDPSTPWLQYINRLLSKDIMQVDTFAPSAFSKSFTVRYLDMRL